VQNLEAGHLTDSFGRKVDFKNTIIIMTTNIGAGVITQGADFGFGKRDADTSYDRMKERLMQEIEREFRPEFIGRLDEVVVFRQLSKENLKAIVDIELAKVRERLQEKGLKLVLSDEAREFIIEKGGAVEYGARPLRRAVENFIEDPLSENLLQGVFQGSNTIMVNVKEVGDKKQLDFTPTNTEGDAELVAAGVGAAAE